MGARLISVFGFFLLACLVAGCQGSGNCDDDRLADTVVSVQDIDSSCHLRIVVAGDLMQHERQILAAQQEDGSFDYSGYFDYVSAEIKLADVAMANYRVYPVNIPDSMLNGLERKLRDDYVKLARDLFKKHNVGVSEFLREAI